MLCTSRGRSARPTSGCTDTRRLQPGRVHRLDHANGTALDGSPGPALPDVVVATDGAGNRHHDDGARTRSGRRTSRTPRCAARTGAFVGCRRVRQSGHADRPAVRTAVVRHQEVPGARGQPGRATATGWPSPAPRATARSKVRYLAGGKDVTRQVVGGHLPHPDPGPRCGHHGHRTELQRVRTASVRSRFTNRIKVASVGNPARTDLATLELRPARR